MNEEIETKRQVLRKRIIRASVTWAVIFAFALWWENPFVKQEAYGVLMAIANAFTIPGAILGGIGGLTYIAKLGGYDSFSYIFSNFALHNIWTKRQPKRYKTFYDYKVAKDEQGRHWLPEFLIAGLISLAIGIILVVIYLFFEP